MSAQDKTEEILRQMHILLAGSEAYDSIGSKIILDKKRMLELLAELNKAIYAMMEEYELTTQGKERARREAAKIGEDILKDASGKAEDIVGKIWAIFFPIMAFVVGGFEHCVANMFYIPVGMMAAQNPAYVAKAQKHTA